MAEPVLFEDVFSVSDVNSAKYDRVSRIQAESLDRACNITLDVNTELYPILVGDKLTLDLASTLNLDGSKDDTKGWREVGMGELTLANEFDYVCHGKIYKFEEGEGDLM
ncbi:putative udp-glucose 4-epimerase gal10 [Phaeomoniella chlamydospora]|uniref:Putative udp-glucose 4-epimerase gal10 n=1 Tax=Phaeomoniella chlamydospora TaxID=158046 RepID=A0A0G2GX06_PHACM|nr:putative udp-glucose 4-epimerase gal10 [Phaeomoniella chlamydospora]